MEDLVVSLLKDMGPAGALVLFLTMGTKHILRTGGRRRKFISKSTGWITFGWAAAISSFLDLNALDSLKGYLNLKDLGPSSANWLITTMMLATVSNLAHASGVKHLEEIFLARRRR